MTLDTIPFRDTFWNVPFWAQVGVYVGGAAAIAIFGWGLWQRIQLWRAGGPEARFDRLPQRVRLVAVHALAQVRTLSQAYPGIMHAIMFWGFLALFMGTVLATIDYDITLPLFDYKLLQGHFYLFYKVTLDLFGLFFVIGLGMALWRRFVVRPARIDPTARFAAVLALLLVINVTGFLLQAARLAAVEPPWAGWSPVGNVIARGMLAAGILPAAATEVPGRALGRSRADDQLGGQPEDRRQAERDDDRCGDEQRQVADIGDAANIGQHIVQRRNTQVRQPQRTGRHAAAGKIDGLEPRPLGQQGMVGVDRAGDLQGFFFTQGLTKGEPG